MTKTCNNKINKIHFKIILKGNFKTVIQHIITFTINKTYIDYAQKKKNVP